MVNAPLSTGLDVPAQATTSGAVLPVTIMVARDNQESEWDNYVNQHPEATIDHLWRWRTVFRDVFGHDCAYLVARRGTAIVGVLPLVCFRSRLFGRSLVSVPFLNYGGVVSSDSDAAVALVERAGEVAREFGASHVELRHRNRQMQTLTYRQHKVGLTRVLPASAEELWTAIDRKVRNQVRKAQKDGLTSEVGGSALIDDFYEVFTRNMRDLGTPVYPKRLFAETMRLFPGDAHVYVVRSAGRAVAAAIALRHRDTVIVPWASSLREYRQQCPNMLLYWAMLEHAIACGARVFDFGRSSRDAGTHHFKVQWGAQEASLHWEYILLTRTAAPDHGPQNPKYAAAIAAWQRLPLWLTRAVGPAIVRNIP
jgi:FemAB-related protein (PEP-CTERM system-associated)